MWNHHDHYSYREICCRVPPAIHKKLALEAAEEGVSLDRLASAKLCQ
jgi:predicted HicB family RNase H-like nuclease